jgi:CDP-2,3-bis-(O-geranylgeranyl)-sn-glycerol synthase
MNFILKAFLLMLPAYVSSPGAVLSRGKKPVDFGKDFFDGKRILGDGKTFEGLALGTLLGFIAGVIAEFLTEEELYGPFSIFLISFGGLFGDMCNSFLKRRLSIGRGEKLPVLDQLNIVFGSWLLCFFFDRNWFFESFNWYIAITVLIMTPLLHRAANILAYKLGLKDVPW